MGINVVGLDIGSTALRAVELSGVNKAKPSLIHFHEIKLPPGAVVKGEVMEPEIVVAALKRLWSEGKFKSKNVVLGTGDQRILVRDMSVPKMPMKRIKESLPFQVQSMLQIPLTDSLLDFYPVSESVGEHGPMVNGLLIAAEKSVVLSNIRVVERAGLTPVEVDLLPFALNELLIGRSEISGTVALIDVGANTTSIVVTIDRVPRFVRIIPTGGEDLTQALILGLEIDADRAEELKFGMRLGPDSSTDSENDDCSCARCLAERNIYRDDRAIEILDVIAAELLGSLRSTISYFNNTWSEHPVEQILLIGGGAQLSGFAEALGEITHIPVRHAEPIEFVAVQRGLKGKVFQRSMTAAMGLALWSNS